MLTCEEPACQADEEPADDEQLVGVADLADAHEDGADHGQDLRVPQPVSSAEPVQKSPFQKAFFIAMETHPHLSAKYPAPSPPIIPPTRQEQTAMEKRVETREAAGATPSLERRA